jgi:hypothetical protein
MCKPLATINRKKFSKELQKGLDEDVFARIHIVDTAEGEELVQDRFGRVTYFYGTLAGKQIPVYQPGTLMFDESDEAGDQEEGESAKKAKKGPMLSPVRALFLARFIGTLIKLYEEKVADKEELDENTLDQAAYTEALSSLLYDLSQDEEVSQEYNSLLNLQDDLATINEDGQLNEEQLALLHIKDVQQLRPGVTTDEVLDNLPTNQEKIQIVQLRVKTRAHSFKFTPMTSLKRDVRPGQA